MDQQITVSQGTLNDTMYTKHLTRGPGHEKCSNATAFSDIRRRRSVAGNWEINIFTTEQGRKGKRALTKQLDELFQDLSPSTLSFQGSCYDLLKGFVLMKQIRSEEGGPAPVVTLQPGLYGSARWCSCLHGERAPFPESWQEMSPAPPRPGHSLQESWVMKMFPAILHRTESELTLVSLSAE